MRVSGGRWCGRNLAAPKTDEVRPTQDRVREALFSMLLNEVPGCSFLDLFAGSGSVGIEALSRGAARATFVEMDPRHLAVLTKNLALVLPDASERAACAETVRADAYAWISTAARGRRFDVAYCDPPYALGAEKGYGAMLKTLAECDVVRPGGLFVAEMKCEQSPEEVEGWTLCRDRRYGQTRVAVYLRDVEGG